MIKKIWILLTLSFLISQTGFTQEKKKKEKSSEPPDSSVVLSSGRVVYKNRIYRQNASYLTFGYGAGYGFESQLVEQNMSLSYHQFIKRIGLQIGYHASSDIKVWWRSYQKLNDLFLGVGKRWESTRYNFSVFGGPSFAYGSYIAWNEERQKDWAYGFATPGLYTELQGTYKFTYDIGVGLSVFASANRYYSVAGAQIHLFFSTAFVRNY
ncbi:MAG: hypothetical protein WC699_12245 [Bacteroidales bacterium]|jgi:hypothetical protein